MMLSKYKTITTKPPEFVHFQLTYSCNLRCKMCGQWGKKGIFKKHISMLKNSEIGFEVWKGLIDEVSKWKCIINIWGGEPLLRKDVFKIIKYVKFKKLKCYMVTNGVLIGKYYRELIDSGIDKIYMSIDGPHVIHDNIRGVKGAYRKIFNGIKKLNDLKKKKKTKSPYLEIKFTISKYNYKIIKNMLKIANNFNANRINFDPFMFTTSKIASEYSKEYFRRFNEYPTSQYGWIVDKTGVDGKILECDISDIISKEKKNFVVAAGYGKVSTDKWYKDAEKTFGFNQCFVPWSLVNVMPNGNVNFCVDFPDYIIGNVTQNSLFDIWNNKRAQVFRKKYLESGPLPICNRCCWLYNDFVKNIDF
ncbi:MAG: radical SAM protein [Candidatus Firestonebacteria bacterium]